MSLYDFFKTALSVTFMIELFCIFTIPISAIFYGILVATNMTNSYLSVLFIFIALGISCLIVLLAISLFMRVRDKFVSYLGEEESFSSVSYAEKLVLTLWVAALIFFGIAVYYGFSLIYVFYVASAIGFITTLMFIFILLGIIIVCAILQVFLIIMVRYTRSVVKEVLVK